MRSRLHRRFELADSDEVVAQVAVIRTAIERAQVFTLVPGAGMMVVGATALAATLAAQRTSTSASWLLIWAAAFVVALAISLIAMTRKAGGVEQLLHSPSARRCCVALLPTAAAGLFVTLFAIGKHWLILEEAAPAWVPALWLVFYGAAVFAAGLVSIAEVRWLGGALALVGIVGASVTAPTWSITAVGFGLLHILFGAWIWRRHEQ